MPTTACPLLALGRRLSFPRQDLHFTEHLVLAAHTSGLRSLFFMVVVVPPWLAFGWSQPWTVAVYFAIWFFYYGVASARFYEGGRWWAGIRGALVALIAQVVTTALVWAAIWATR